jgi:hypothetical protein
MQSAAKSCALRVPHNDHGFDILLLRSSSRYAKFISSQLIQLNKRRFALPSFTMVSRSYLLKD